MIAILPFTIQIGPNAETFRGFLPIERGNNIKFRRTRPEELFEGREVGALLKISQKGIIITAHHQKKAEMVRRTSRRFTFFFHNEYCFG